MKSSLPSRYSSLLATNSWLRGIFWGTLCAGCASLLALLPMMRTVDDWLFDACISLRGERESAHANKIIIVGLDEESYQLLGVPSQYISPKLASVIDFLNQQKVSAIGVDFLVPEYAEGFPGIAVGLSRPRVLSVIRSRCTMPCSEVTTSS